MKEKISIKRSHAVKSNLQLVLLCLFATVATALFWISLALMPILQIPLFLLLFLPSALCVVLSAVLFLKFRR